VVYVASGSDFADALSAAPAAAHRGGPMLLVSQSAIPAVTSAELTRLAPQQIVIVGGTGAVGESVANELAGIATTRRIGGVDRYETSRFIVDDAFGNADVAYVATGLDFPDGLSAGAAAGAVDAPVLLIDGRLGGIDDAALELFAKKGVGEIRLAGGTSVITTGIESSLRAGSLTVNRFAGADRYATSSAIVADAFQASRNVFVATGLQFPDALTGAAAAGAAGEPLVLARPTCVPGGVRSTVLSLGVTAVTLLGGTSALAEPVGRLEPC
jgi:putative cell wall-binding protein